MNQKIEPAEPENDRPQPDVEADMPALLAGAESMYHQPVIMGIDPGDPRGDMHAELTRRDAGIVEIKTRYAPTLSPMQQTIAMLTGTTPQDITRASWRAPTKARKTDAKAKAKRKQAKASRARNRK